jgi:hypothetical protein
MAFALEVLLLHSVDPCEGLVIVALQITELLLELFCLIALCHLLFTHDLI